YELDATDDIDVTEKLDQQLLFKDQAHLRFGGRKRSPVGRIEPDGADWQISNSAEPWLKITISTSFMA
ncbi:hypothetical protein KIN20_005385, partial [Parelaphostrongylus tenuis]